MQVTVFSRAAVVLMLAANTLPAQNTVLQDRSTGQISANQDSLTIQDFGKRVDQYAKLRKSAQAGLSAPKSGSSAAEVKQYQVSLAQNIRAGRTQAKPGDVFSPPVALLFRKLIATPFQSGDGSKIRASLRHAEPVRGLKLEVNGEYPQMAALQSTPPTLLSDLPKLPLELEYRIVGRELVLLDSSANLIVDLLPDALPTSQTGP
jgi:hypothetical protein